MSKRRKRKVKACPGGYPSAWYWYAVRRYERGHRTVEGALIAASGLVEQGRLNLALEAVVSVRWLHLSGKA